MKKIAVLLLICLTARLAIGQTKKTFPIKITGSVGTRSYFTTSSQSPMYQANPFGYSLFGSATVQVSKHLSLPFSISYSNRKATFSQPFNQFGISPTFKGFTVHAGYRNLRFSDYTLNGFTMLGGGFEVQKGIIRAGFMMGRFTRATSSIEGLPTNFLRVGWSGRIGIGKKENFVDLVLLKAEDVTSSIPNFEVYRLNPASNLVLGLVVNQKINLNKKTKQALLFKADGAFSIYTGNILSENLDTTNFQNLPPVIFKTVSPNVSSRGILAVNSSLAYNHRNFGVKLGYNRVEPGFASMGIYTTNNDIEVISLSPRFMLFKNKLVVNGNVKQQRDNLVGDKARSTKRLLPNATVAFTPSAQFGVVASLNFSTINQTPGIKRTNPVPYNQLMNQTNYNLMLMPHYNFEQNGLAHGINASLGSNKLADKGEDLERKKYAEFSGLNGSLSYSLGLEKFGISANAGANYFSLTNFDPETNTPQTVGNIGYSLGLDKTFLKNKITSTFSAAYTISQFRDVATNFAVGASYRPQKHHSFSLNFYQSNSAFTDNETRNFNEFKGTFDYTYNF